MNKTNTIINWIIGICHGKSKEENLLTEEENLLTEELNLLAEELRRIRENRVRKETTDIIQHCNGRLKYHIEYCGEVSYKDYFRNKCKETETLIKEYYENQGIEVICNFIIDDNVSRIGTLELELTWNHFKNDSKK